MSTLVDAHEPAQPAITYFSSRMGHGALRALELCMDTSSRSLKSLMSLSSLTALVLSASLGCSSVPGDEGVTTAATLGSTGDVVVAGTKLDATQRTQMAYIAKVVVPRLAGTRTARAHTAALVAWWSLREDIVHVERPIRFSNCAPGEQKLDVLTSCNGSMWQVGLAGIQVFDHPDLEVANTRKALFPYLTESELLPRVAKSMGYGETSATYQAIQASSGALRRALILRDVALAATLNEPAIARCLASPTPNWCYGNHYAMESAFAATPAKIKTAVADLEKLFLGDPDDLVGSSTDPCAAADLGDGGYCATYFDAKASTKTLYTCAGGRTATAATCKSGCQRMPDGQDDTCRTTGSPAGPARDAMIARAESWVAVDMPYCGGLAGGKDWYVGAEGYSGSNQCVLRTGSKSSPTWDKYRSDCSGFVSFVWQLPANGSGAESWTGGYNTWGFAPMHQQGPQESHEINVDSLLPGDALNTDWSPRGDQHIALFAGWVDKSQHTARILQETWWTTDITDSVMHVDTVSGSRAVLREDGRTFVAIRKNGL
ncbi:hypothetical protein BH09MYX1_BH09MYX1_61000 [soil metagenome]